jgi:hypothetical protein
MAKVTIVCLLASSVILLVTFGKGIAALQGGSVSAHMSWAMATLVSVLAANFIAMIHAAHSARIIRDLRARIAALGPHPGDV